jgi:hypothetical protein
MIKEMASKNPDVLGGKRTPVRAYINVESVIVRLKP